MNSNIKRAQKTLALIKFFSQEAHYLSFKSGHSILRTPHFFRTCEDVGRGDRNESCIGYWDKELGHEMPDIVLDGKPFEMEDVKSCLMYPVHEQHDAWLQSWCLIDSHNDFEESLQRMVDEFGSYFVVLPAENIGKYAKLLNAASGLPVRYGLVQYSNNPLERSLTVKNSDLGYQKEFRFYLGECKKDEMRDKKIQLEGLEDILAAANSLKMMSPSGKTYYFSLGGKKVVIT